MTELSVIMDSAAWPSGTRATQAPAPGPSGSRGRESPYLATPSFDDCFNERGAEAIGDGVADQLHRAVFRAIWADDANLSSGYEVRQHRAASASAAPIAPAG